MTIKWHNMGGFVILRKKGEKQSYKIRDRYRKMCGRAKLKRQKLKSGVYKGKTVFNIYIPNKCWLKIKETMKIKEKEDQLFWKEHIKKLKDE